MTDFDWFITDGESDSYLNGLLISALQRLYASSFKELLKASGKVETLNALKPYMKMAMLLHIRELKKVMPISGNGPDALINVFRMAQASIIPPIDLIAEMNEKGVVELVKKCPFGKESSDLCIFLSHFSSQYICELMNPEYECIVTNHLTDGDPYCRFVFVKKSDSSNNLDDLGKTIIVFPPLEIPPQQLCAMNVIGPSSGLNMITSAFIDLHGSEKATSILCPNAMRIGREIGDILTRNRKMVESSSAEIGQLVQHLGSIVRQQEKSKTISGDAFSLEVTDCAFQTWNKEVCMQYEAMLQGVVEEINPDYEFVYDRMMSKGDKTCHWMVRKKETSPKEKPKEEGPVDDPIMRLANKLVDGEITEEEFERKMTLLKKHSVVK